MESARAWTCSASWPCDRACGRGHRPRRHPAQLHAASEPLCAVVKANAYGHGTVPVAEAALAGGADWLAVATAAEAAELRAAPHRRAGAGHGALTRDELQQAIDADADVVAWTQEVADAAPRVHVKLDTGMGRLGTRDRRACAALGGAAECGRAHDPLRDRRRAGRRPLRRASWRVPRLRRRAVGRDDLLVHAANSAAALRDPASHFDMVRCGVAIYGLDPFQPDPADHGSSRRCRCAPGWRRCGAWRQAKAPATAAAGRRSSPPGSRPCRSVTATAGGARSRTTPTS